MSTNGYEEISNNELNWSFTAGFMGRFDLPLGAR
jgi:hypothetical protein